MIKYTLQIMVLCMIPVVLTIKPRVVEVGCWVVTLPVNWLGVVVLGVFFGILWVWE